MRFLIKILLSAILFCAMTALVHAQKPMQYVKLGDEAADLGRWDEAYSYYEQAFLLDSTAFILEITKKTMANSSPTLCIGWPICKK
jgi:hypothetical protein